MIEIPLQVKMSGGEEYVSVWSRIRRLATTMSYRLSRKHSLIALCVFCVVALLFIRSALLSSGMHSSRMAARSDRIHYMDVKNEVGLHRFLEYTMSAVEDRSIWPTKSRLFEMAVEDAAGIYAENPANGSATPMTRDFSKDIILVSANFAYLDFILNWACHLQLTNKSLKYLLISQDRHLHQHINKYTYIKSFDGALIGMESTSAGTTYRSEGFNHISMTKVAAARQVLDLGYNVLFSDVDISWFQDPIPHFKFDVDFEFQSNHFSMDFQVQEEPNTGFYYMKSTPLAKRFMWEVSQLGKVRSNIDDQTNLADVLRWWRIREKAVYIPMDVSNVDVSFKMHFFSVLHQRSRIFAIISTTYRPWVSPDRTFSRSGNSTPSSSLLETCSTFTDGITTTVKPPERRKV